jgi:penicillin amidase
MQKKQRDFQKGLSYFSPGIKRDVWWKGNIAWWATGKLYKHNDGVETHFILDGSSEKTILLNIWISPTQSAVNPEWNFVYSANNQAEAVDDFISWLLSSRRQLKELPSY